MSGERARSQRASRPTSPSVDPFLPRAYATRNVPGADR